jgi:hypothetical protein
MLVPEAYGFKSINGSLASRSPTFFHANDTYADGNNDVDSSLKNVRGRISLCRPRLKPGAPIPRHRLRPSRSGRPEQGPGLGRIQRHRTSARDPYFLTAPWSRCRDPASAETLGRNPRGAQSPPGHRGFDPANGQPQSWPMRLGKVYLGRLASGPAGKAITPLRSPERSTPTASLNPCRAHSKNPPRRH